MAVLAQSSRVPPMTVEALVACGRHPHLAWGGRLGPDDRAAVEAAMERAGVARFRSHDLRQLSGGERQRAHVARTLAQDTDLIVLDEPTTYLDISACHDLMALVRDLNRREGKTVAMVIHDLDLALRYSDYLVVMQKGRVVDAGPTDEVLASGARRRRLLHGHLPPRPPAFCRTRRGFRRARRNRARLRAVPPSPLTGGARPRGLEARGPEVPRPRDPEARRSRGIGGVYRPPRASNGPRGCARGGRRLQCAP